MQIKDSVILITGGSSGLGAGCVRHFSELGAQVVIADLKEPSQELLTHDVSFVRTDVTQEADVRNALATAQEIGELRSVILCAGIIHGERINSPSGPFDLEKFRQVIEVNLVGTFNVMRLAAEAMKENTLNDQEERGVIITTASVAAFEGQIGKAAYSASKGGVAALTLPAARELGRFGIRVSCIAPGVFETPMMEGFPEKRRLALESQIPFPSRLGTPREYALLAGQILENPMLNGNVIRLDGAIRMTPK